MIKVRNKFPKTTGKGPRFSKSQNGGNLCELFYIGSSLEGSNLNGLLSLFLIEEH